MRIFGHASSKELHKRPYRGQPVEWRRENALFALADMEPYLLQVARIDKHACNGKDSEQHTQGRDTTCSKNADIDQPVRTTY